MKNQQAERSVRLGGEELVFLLGLNEYAEAIIAVGRKELREPARKYAAKFKKRIHSLKFQKAQKHR